MSKLIRRTNKNFGAALLIGARSSTAGDIPVTLTVNLEGPTLGRIAFSRALPRRILKYKCRLLTGARAAAETWCLSRMHRSK
jgi:hypothetical protein